MRSQERESTACPYQQRVSLVLLRRRLIDRGDTEHSGVMMSPKEQVTVQKYDMQFGTNVIGKCLSPSG